MVTTKVRLSVIAAVAAATAVMTFTCSETSTDDGPQPPWGRWVNVGDLPGPGNKSITALGADPDGGVWVCVDAMNFFDKGLYRWDGSSWAHIDDELSSLTNIDPVAVARVWATDIFGRAWCWNDGHWDEYDFKEDLTDLSFVSADEGWFLVRRRWWPQLPGDSRQPSL